jgi:hypothetical protein
VTLIELKVQRTTSVEGGAGLEHRDEYNASHLIFKEAIHRMDLKQPIMRIGVKIDGNFILYGNFKLLVQICNRLSHPAILLVIILAITDENVIFISGMRLAILSVHYNKVRKAIYASQINRISSNPYKRMN